LSQENPSQPDVVGVMKLRRGQSAAFKLFDKRFVGQVGRAPAEDVYVCLSLAEK